MSLVAPLKAEYPNYWPINHGVEKEDAALILNEDMLFEIFSRVDFTTFEQLCLVTKGLHDFSITNMKWIAYNQAFTSDKWGKFFPELVKNENLIEEFKSLPVEEVQKANRKFKAILGKPESVMLVRIPKGLTLQILSDFAKTHFPPVGSHCPQIDSGFVHFNDNMKQTLMKDIDPADEAENNNNVDPAASDAESPKSEWMIMTTDVLPGTRNTGIALQQMTVATKASGYRIPTTLEAVAGIISYQLRTHEFIFSTQAQTGQPTTNTHCSDSVGNNHAAVGSFGPNGLWVFEHHVNHIDTGVAVVKRV